jgi:hypothetical protein
VFVELLQDFAETHHLRRIGLLVTERTQNKGNLSHELGSDHAVVTNERHVNAQLSQLVFHSAIAVYCKIDFA